MRSGSGGSERTSPEPLTSAICKCCRPRGAYFALSLGGLIGTCREVLATLGLPSRQVWLMTVSRTRKNFSASMCVAPLTIASLVLLRLAGFKFNHLSESAAC